MTAEIDLLSITRQEDRREDSEIYLPISINQWGCAAEFAGAYMGQLSISFEGVFWCMLENMKSMRVIGDIDVVNIKPLDSDRNGYLRLLNMADDPFLGIHLKCNMETNEYLFKAFSAAFANTGDAGMNLNLRKPDDAQDDFWKIGWQEQKVDISGFRIYIGGFSLKPEWQEKLFSERQ